MLKDTIRRLRKAKGLTQKQLGDQVGVSAAAVTQWETGGGIDMPNLKNVAKALGVPAKVLIEEDETDRSINSGRTDESGHDRTVTSGNNAQAPKTDAPHQEGLGMGEDSTAGLRDVVLKDILARLARLEGKVLDTDAESPDTQADPRKRRRV